MFLGTGSDVGKSIAVTAFCRILSRRGFKVAPFKAQNMSNNSYVTVEGGEIGRAQVVQAEAAGLLPSIHMNPVLLKPSSGVGSQVVIHGKVFKQMDAMKFYQLKPILKRPILDSYNFLSQRYDIVLLEGAGSCCEMNLKDKDLANLPMAKEVGARCILVADIDRGGIFAQIIGTMELMDRDERDMVIGFLINKFRGDPRLFRSGIEYIEKATGKPVLGLIPYYDNIMIDPEDSMILQKDRRSPNPLRQDAINIGVVRLPSISNFTDFELLEREPDVVLNYLSSPKELDTRYDMLIVPGSKNVISDGIWLERTGWKRKIREFKKLGKWILGICGGYQLMGKEIKDPWGVESDKGKIKGLGILPVETVLEREKIVREVVGICLINRKRIKGYEIHMGRTRVVERRGRGFLKIHGIGEKKSWIDGWVNEDERIFGTYVHGILDSSGFRAEFLNQIRRVKGLKQRRPKRGISTRTKEYDKLADHFETHCEVDRIIQMTIQS